MALNHSKPVPAHKNSIKHNLKYVYELTLNVVTAYKRKRLKKINQARLKNMLACRHMGLFFPVYLVGRKKIYHFEMEKIALILIYDIFVTKKFFSGMNVKKIF